MEVKYIKKHNEHYSEIILEIWDSSENRTKNIDKLEKKILALLSKEKGE